MTAIPLRWAARSDTGRVRQQNEDSIHADGNVFVVADGMGGHLAGEVASAVAVSTIVDQCRGGIVAKEQLRDALVEANKRVLNESAGDAGREGMGTTVVAVVRLNGSPSHQLALANIGDSRAYLFDSSGLHQLSKDHSLVQELVDDGLIAPSDARHHPRRNIVTRAIGIEPEVQVDLWEFQLAQNSRVLLCSDGLVDEVEESLIEEVLRTEVDIESAADRLIAMANDHGGRDNISLVIVEESTSQQEPPPTEEIPLEGLHPGVSSAKVKTRRGIPRAGILATGVTLLALAAIMAALAVNWVRSTFTVTFDGEGEVVVMQGRDVLWFDPTVVARGPIERDRLDGVSRDLVEQTPTFDTLREAETFVAEGLTASATAQPKEDR